MSDDLICLRVSQVVRDKLNKTFHVVFVQVDWLQQIIPLTRHNCNNKITATYIFFIKLVTGNEYVNIRTQRRQQDSKNHDKKWQQQYKNFSRFLFDALANIISTATPQKCLRTVHFRVKKSKVKVTKRLTGHHPWNATFWAPLTF